jgi:hypothetical protein
MIINEAHAEKAMHFRRKNRIGGGTLIVTPRGAQGESDESAAGVVDAGKSKRGAFQSALFSSAV